MDLPHPHQFNSQDEFSAIMDAIPVMVRACDTNGKIRYFNNAWKSLTAERFSWAEGIHPDFLMEWAKVFAAHSDLQTPFNIKYRFSQNGSAYRWMAEQSVPWYSADGVFLGFVCYTHDIDELVSDHPMEDQALQREQALNEELAASNEELNVSNEELQRSQEQISQVNSNLEQILNMLPASVVVIRGQDLVVEMINNSNLDYWKKAKEEVVGKPFLADQPFAGQLRRVMDTGEVIDVKESPVLFASEDGSVRETYVDYTYQPLSDLDGKRTGVLVMSFEITERVLSRRLLEKYAEELSMANTRLMATNEELALSDARFKYLIQEAPVAIGVLHGRDLVVESANIKILEVWGKSPDIVGLPLSVALPELEGQPFLDILDQVYTTGKPFYANEISAMLEHGGEMKEIFFNVVYQPVADSSGSTADILVVAVDVTQQVNSRKQVERSEQHFRYLADLIPAKISNALPSGEVTFFNKEWLDFAGMGFEDLRDFGYHRMMHPEEIPAFQDGLAQAASTGMPFASEMRFKNTDGKFIWHLNVASPVLDAEGEITMWVGSTTNIQSLKEEEQRKSDFIGMVAHELKTPLTSLNGYLQLLRRKAEKSGDGVASNALGQSLKQVKQMTVMINGFLNVSRLESGKIHIDKTNFDLSELTRETEEEHLALHSSHQIVFRNFEPVALYADRAKIGQVINNLVSNAVKYSGRSSTVEVSYRKIEDKVRISVTDEGIGIREEDLGKLFERYYRVENNNVSGFGIGLYLSAEIVERHQGRIWADSEPGKGSTFYFELPLG
jgi:PAS domain S-box-containing protein